MSIKYCLLVVKTRTYIRLIFIILSFLSPILIEKICNYLKVTDIHSQKSFSGEDKPQQNRERKKSTNMPTTASCLHSFFLFTYDSSFLVYIVRLLLLLLLQFFIRRSLSYFDRFVLSHKREHIVPLSILFSSSPISQQYRHIIESPSTGDLSLIRFLFNKKKKKTQAMLHIVKLDKHT